MPPITTSQLLRMLAVAVCLLASALTHANSGGAVLRDLAVLEDKTGSETIASITAAAPAVVRLFQAQGIEVHEVHPGVEANRDGEGIEIDLLVVNDGVLVAVECKSKLTQVHVDEHLARMEKLKRLLPSYKNHRALGAVAAMVIGESVKSYAHGKGLYVLYQNGESVEVGNLVGFNPKAW